MLTPPPDRLETITLMDWDAALADDSGMPSGMPFIFDDGQIGNVRLRVCGGGCLPPRVRCLGNFTVSLEVHSSGIHGHAQAG